MEITKHPSSPSCPFTHYIWSHTFALGLTGVNRPLPEVAFNGEQELLVAPEDLFVRNKREWKSERVIYH